MRLVAIATFFLLALAGLTILPMAAADPACTTDLCGPFPPEPSCSEKSFMGLGDDTNTLTTHSDCTATLETGKGQICVGAWSTTTEHQIGPLHWTEHRCTFPGGDPLCCLTTASSSADPQFIPPCASTACPAPACKPESVSDGTVFGLLGGLVQLGMVYNGPHAGARLNSDCTVDAWETNFPCEPNLLPLAPDQAHESVGRAEVTADTCTIGFICACMPAGTDSASPQAIPPCQCPPPQPLCQNVNRLLAPGNGPVRYQLTDYCHVRVIVDVSETCGLQGKEWTNTTENPVELDYHHCQSPPPQQVESANPFPTCVRECLPGPDACTLRDATPAAGPSVGPITPIALRQSIWGNDCTVDLDPIGACAPPSGSSKDVYVAFVHVHLLLCGGNPPPVT
jgi:hypothetical protein